MVVQIIRTILSCIKGLMQDRMPKSGEEKRKRKCGWNSNMTDKVSVFIEQSWKVQSTCFRIYVTMICSVF